MDLQTEYLGLKLPHPLVVGASPLADDVDMARRLEDAGAAALVMRSLFAEQIVRENLNAYLHEDDVLAARSASTAFLLPSRAFAVSPDDYLEKLAALKAALDIPVIASLNGAGPGQWLEYASLLEAVGADALELNLQPGGAEVTKSSAEIEAGLLETVQIVRAKVTIPIAVKLPPSFSGLAVLAQSMQDAGADSLVLFSRPASQDIDPGTLSSLPPIVLSRTTELPLRLRWLAILSTRLRIPIAAVGGIHDEMAAIKALMAGARVVQMVSALLARGPRHLREVLIVMADWMEAHGYEKVSGLRGCMDLSACPDAEGYERATDIVALQRWPG